MAGWTCHDNELIEWDGVIRAKSFIPAGIGDHTLLTNIGTMTHTEIEGEVHSVSGSLVSLSGAHYALYASHEITSGAYIAHADDSSDPHGATLTQTTILGTTISGATFNGGRFNSGDAQSGACVNVYSGTSATPPTANTTPLGSLYIQYTP